MATAIRVTTHNLENHLFSVDKNISSKELETFLRDRLDDDFNYIEEIQAVYSNGKKLIPKFDFYLLFNREFDDWDE